MKVVKIIAPPDKSISQRAIMLASISEGRTHIKNLLLGDDCLRAIEAFRDMGVRIDIAAASYLSRAQSRDAAGLAPQGGAATVASSAAQGAAATDVVVHGVGMHGLKKPKGHLYIGNSGTTMRILPGILAGQDFEAVLKGDASLSKRPMKRIVEPLRKMGAEVKGSRSKAQGKDIYPPLKIHGAKLRGIEYKSKIASAQVKSCILLAGLYADGTTSVTEPVKSRDHSERMLSMFGCRVSLDYARDRQGAPRLRSGQAGCRVSLKGPAKLKSPGVIRVPGDISSAAFFMVAGCILPGMKIILEQVGLNPTRTGVIDILKKMNANISLEPKASSLEPYGDIIARSSKLKGVAISAKEAMKAIDEIPIIMVAACFAKGRTVINGIRELRVKETDRIKSMVTNLRKMGADVNVAAKLALQKGRASSIPTESIVIKGGKPLHSAVVSSFGDHRTAMSMLIAGLAVKDIKVKDLDCINKSFPGFEKVLRKLN
ncbi:MAG: 3-phosphoshikimate 1-carboxyvinyltransferase [Candidatus Omnitrophota bacterium]